MAKKLAIIEVRGERSRWVFDTYVDPQYLAAWRADGLTIYLIENTIPEWVADLGLAGPWCFLQDLFNFRNPWRKG